MSEYKQEYYQGLHIADYLNEEAEEGWKPINIHPIYRKGKMTWSVIYNKATDGEDDLDELDDPQSSEGGEENIRKLEAVSDSEIDAEEEEDGEDDKSDQEGVTHIKIAGEN